MSPYLDSELGDYELIVILTDDMGLQSAGDSLKITVAVRPPDSYPKINSGAPYF